MRVSEQEKSLSTKLNEKISSNWRIYSIIITVFILVIASILVAGIVSKNKKISSAELSEDIQDEYSKWIGEPDNKEIQDTLENLFQEAFKNYPNMFASQRAYYTKGLMALNNKEWDEAVESFTALADNFAKSYLAPASLFNAAMAAEESGEDDIAAGLLKRLVDDYGTTAPQTPEALFNLGRLAEKTGDTDKALKYYKEIGTEYPQSRWTDLGKTRILKLESKA